MRENGGLADMRQVAELTALIADERVSHEELEVVLRRYRGYAGILAAAIAGCACDTTETVDPAEFTPEIFGELGDGYVLGEAPIMAESRKRGYWIDEDFDAYVQSDAVKGQGLEAASLADLCKYGKENPEKQREVGILCWRPTKGGCVSLLGRYGFGRRFYVFRREGYSYWSFDCRVLLRKVRQLALRLSVSWLSGLPLVDWSLGSSIGANGSVSSRAHGTVRSRCETGPLLFYSGIFLIQSPSDSRRNSPRLRLRTVGLWVWKRFQNGREHILRQRVLAIPANVVP
jgi:hypothetical protein